MDLPAASAHSFDAGAQAGAAVSRRKVGLCGLASLILVGLFSWGAFYGTNARCTPGVYSGPVTPRDMWGRHFTGYCGALHAVRVFNYNGGGVGGGALEGLFVIPVALVLVGSITAMRRRKLAPLAKYLLLGGVACAVLWVLTYFATGEVPPYAEAGG